MASRRGGGPGGQGGARRVQTYIHVGVTSIFIVNKNEGDINIPKHRFLTYELLIVVYITVDQ